VEVIDREMEDVQTRSFKLMSDDRSLSQREHRLDSVTTQHGEVVSNRLAMRARTRTASNLPVDHPIEALHYVFSVYPGGIIE
jgi:hypothetical protein